MPVSLDTKFTSINVFGCGTGSHPPPLVLGWYSIGQTLEDYLSKMALKTRLGSFYVTAILSWGYGWGWVDWYWGWGWFEPEVEMRLSRSLVELELRFSWDKLTLNKGRNLTFIGVGLWFKICFRSTYVAEQHMFSMLLLISSNFKGQFF